MTTIDQVHATHEAVANVEITPPHPPRTETPEYRKAHDFLIHVKKQGCHICGVTVDTLGDAARNPAGATQLETHHYPVERSLLDACDPVRVHADFPQVYDQATLEQFVDSPSNLVVLCDQHHRSGEQGIHHLLTQDWIIQKYLKATYQIAATAQDAAQVEAHDAQVLGAVAPVATVAAVQNVKPRTVKQ